MNIVHRPVPDDFDQLVVLSSQHRLYAARRAKGNGFHVVQPAQLDDPRVGDGKVAAGSLICVCPAGAFGRICWAARLAIAFEQSTPIERIPWLDAPIAQQEVTTSP